YYKKILSSILVQLPYSLIGDRYKEGQIFYPAPSMEKDQRDNILVYGSSGSGKSCFAADFIRGVDWYFNTRIMKLKKQGLPLNKEDQEIEKAGVKRIFLI